MASMETLIKSALDLAETLNLRVAFTHEPFLSIDTYGKPTFSTATTVKGVWDPRQRHVRTAEGREVVSRGSAIFPETPAMTVKDRITLPDGSKPVLLEVRPYQGTAGRLFQEVIFG